MIEVRYNRGVYLPEQDLWLDPWDAKPFAFVSHAHSDHIAPHQEIILSERTARLLQARMPGQRKEHVLAFGERHSIRGIDITLLPAGHIFGSAQILVTIRCRSLLYTGDFKLRPGRSAEPAEWQDADTLIMETTYGLPRYRLPPTEQVVEQIVAFSREAIEEGIVPVLLGYSLGKAQEILCALDGAGLTPMLHGSVFAMTRIYEQFGQAFCKYVRYAPNEVAGKVLICPPECQQIAHVGEDPAQARGHDQRLGRGSGRNLSIPGRCRLSSFGPCRLHRPDALRRTGPAQRVLTLHGFAAEFARDLRDRGIEAWALSAQNQLELGLQTPAALPKRTERKPSGESPERVRESPALPTVGVCAVCANRRSHCRDGRETGEDPDPGRIT